MRTDNNWIQTYTGRQFWPLDPHEDDIDIDDIAHALGMKCRFTGHCQEFYSVAEHSVIVSQIMAGFAADAIAAGADPLSVSQWALWGLLHDAPEAYLPDVARPVKRELVGFQEIEDRLMACIARKFGLMGEMPEQIKQADLIALATERRDLMPSPPRPWKTTEGIEPLKQEIKAWYPYHAVNLFQRRWQELSELAVVAALGEHD